MKKLFKVTFTNEKHEAMQLYAEDVNSAEMLGFIEASGLVFIDSSDLIINPEDDKLKKLFKDTSRVLFPINSVVRVEEVMLDRNTPILQIFGNNEKSS